MPNDREGRTRQRGTGDERQAEQRPRPLAAEASSVLAKPWVRGALELIRHADGHLQNAGDTDRRIALIGFDNAIEVCIDIFIKLHPKLRSGMQIKNEDKEKALRNYHSKIEFLDEFVASQNASLDVPIEVIVWYHSLRNELYHSGNGMVPELHVVEGAKAAAYAVFKALFEIDAAPVAAGEGAKPRGVESVPYLGQSDVMEFLRIFIDFERSLQIAIQRQHPEANTRQPLSQLWRLYRAQNQILASWDATVHKAMNIRNYTAHGQDLRIADDELIALALELSDIGDVLRKRGST
jgi:hypothetical protein